MDELSAPLRIIEEKRLIRTMITRRPSAQAFFVTALTIGFTILATLFYWQAPVAISDFLPVANASVFKDGQIWRLFTAIFIHADVEHLLSNMLLLSVFSFFIFGYFGFGVFPFLSYLLAGVVNLIAIATYPPQTELLGASGLVYLLGGFWLALYFMIQRQYRIVNRLMRVTGIAMILFLPSTFVPTTSYRTHAIGFVIGILMGVYYFLKNKEKIRSFEVYKVTLVEDIL